MGYPLFEVPRLGAGMFVAIVAVLHVLIAHAAVGGGFFAAFSHTRALRTGDATMLDFLRRFSIFLVIVSFVLGVVTGVGIWVTISLTSPPATSALIHLFLWGWAIEWCFFIVEIAAGYAYYYGWKRLPPKRHLACAWIYCISAFGSLVVINGIVAFMLTPGAWQPPAESSSPQASFWIGFFNPSYWPSVLLRTISSLALAGLAVMILVNLISSYTHEQRHRVIRAASYLLVPIGLMAPLALWYFAALPRSAAALAMGGSIAMTLFLAFGVAASVLIAGYSYFALIRRRSYVDTETAILLFGIAIIATGAMEFVREGVRKPYLIYDYMYSNGFLAKPAKIEQVNRNGVLAYSPFSYPPHLSLAQAHQLPPLELGEAVFTAQCRICHEPAGTNAIGPLIGNASRELIEQITDELHKYKSYMPPFMGTEQEKQALVEYQLWLAEQYQRQSGTGSIEGGTSNQIISGAGEIGDSNTALAGQGGGR